MWFRRSLRYRVALAFAFFGGAVSLVLAGGLYLASHNLEAHLIDDTLTAELDEFIAHQEHNPVSPPPATAAIRGYRRALGAAPVNIPTKVAALRPGRYHIVLGDAAYRVAVADHGGVRYYLLYKLTQLKRLERYFVIVLGSAVLIMALVSAAGGLWLAGRVISPVTELVHRVRRLRPDDVEADLARGFPEDEVGELARAFERYLDRLQAFIERERSFTADVSHELRTPLAIMNGATEVMLQDPRLDDRLRARVERLARAGREMSELTSALLVLAREEVEGVKPASECDVEEVLNDTVAVHRYLLEGKPVALDMAVNARPTLPADRAVLSIVLGNLVRNAFSYTEQGSVRIELDPEQVTVRDTGIGIDQGDLVQIFDRYYRGASSKGAGIGLALVKRICDRYGWHITIDSAEGQGATVRLSFDARGGRGARAREPVGAQPVGLS